MEGTLEVLNVGAGDVRIKCDDEAGRRTAKAMVRQMLRDGYAIVVEDEDGVCRVVQDLDDEHDEYIVAGLPAAGRGAPREAPPEAREAPLQPKGGLAPTTPARRPRASVQRRGSWAKLLVDGAEYDAGRGLRPSEAGEMVVLINEKSLDPDVAVRRVLDDRRRPMTQSRATAIAPSAGG